MTDRPDWWLRQTASELLRDAKLYIEPNAVTAAFIEHLDELLTTQYEMGIEEGCEDGAEEGAKFDKDEVETAMGNLTRALGLK